MAAGGRQEDAGDVEGVQDLLGGVPQPGGFEKLDVEASPMPNWLAAAQEIGEQLEGGFGIRGAPQFVLLDARQAEDGFRHRSAGIDQPLQRGGDPV